MNMMLNCKIHGELYSCMIYWKFHKYVLNSQYVYWRKWEENEKKCFWGKATCWICWPDMWLYLMCAFSIFIFNLSHYGRKFNFSLLILNLYHNKIGTFTTSPKSCLPIDTWVFKPWSNSASHIYHGVSSRLCIMLRLWKCREHQWSIASMLPAIHLVVE